MSFVVYCSIVSISENIAYSRTRIAEAAKRAGRHPEEIALMAVSKTHPPERIREAMMPGFVCLARIACRSLPGKLTHSLI